MYISWDRATERPSMPAHTIWCLGPSPRVADYYIFAWKTLSSCPRTGHKYFGRLLQMKQMWNNAYYIIHCRETENAKVFKTHNVQKVLATGVCENPVSVVLEVVPCMYLLNFLVLIVVVLKWFSVTGKAHHSILPLKVGVVVTNHGKTSNILMIQVGFTLLLVVSLIVAANLLFMYKAFCDVWK